MQTAPRRSVLILVRHLVIVAMVAVGCAIAPRAQASFSIEQAETLASGTPIVEPLEYQRGEQHYVGGVSYLVIDSDIARLSSIVRDVSRFAELMPNVSEAKLLSLSKGGAATVRVTHRVGPTHGSYTMKIAFSDEGRLGRFAIDQTADNAVEDAWGFVRLTPIAGGTRTLVTYGVLFDLGPGVLRTLFESRIRQAALSYPSRLADAAKR